MKNNFDKEWRGEALHLGLAVAFAVAQPVYDLLARNPAFLVIRRSQPIDVLGLTFLLSVLLPLALALVIQGGVSLLGRDLRRAAHRLTLAVCGSLVFLPALKRVPWMADGFQLLAALCLGAGVALIYHSFGSVRKYFTFLAPAIVVFPALFLFNPGISRLVFPPRIVPIANVDGASPTVVFLVFDALPLASLMSEDATINQRVFPAFAGLASTATWYRNATTVSGRTDRAVPAILSGRYPLVSYQPSLADYPDNLFTLLGGSYRMAVNEPITLLCPEQVCGRDVQPLETRWKTLWRDLSVVYTYRVLPHRWTADLPVIADQWKDFGRGRPKNQGDARLRKLEVLEDLIGAIQADDESRLYFAHFLWPHRPYEFLPSGVLYPVGDERPPERITGDRWTAAESQQRHLLQVGFADHVLGTILDRLHDLGLFDEALIVVTADHGVSFSPSTARRLAERGNLAEILPVPLLIKGPGQRLPVIDDRNAETVDILPTVADLLEIDLPFSVDGHSLIRSSISSRPIKKFMSRLTNSEFETKELSPSLLDELTAVIERNSADFVWTDAGFPRLRRHSALIGHRLDEYELETVNSSGLTLRLLAPELYEDVRPDSGVVPAHIRGWVRFSEPSRAKDLVVAVNGVVRSVQPLGGGDEQREWSTMVPEESFEAGSNRIDVFVLAGDPDRPRLIPTMESLTTEPFLDLRLGHQRVTGIYETGFHRAEGSGNERFRWTTGSGMLAIPVRALAQATAVRIELADFLPQPTRLQVTANNVVIHDEIVAVGGWAKIIPLQGPLQSAGRSSPLRIRLNSDVLVPKLVIEGARDSRQLGVAVVGIWLLSEDGVKQLEGGEIEVVEVG